MTAYLCRVCGSKSLKEKYTAKEMMFGTRESFIYDECAKCLSLQITRIPDNETIARHYPPTYYSFKEIYPDQKFLLKDRFKQWLRLERDKALVGQITPVGHFLKFIKPLKTFKEPSSMYNILRASGLGPDRGQRVLDVGCGSGVLLNELAALGYKNLFGIDAFIDSDMITKAGVFIRKRSLDEIEDSFDLIMYHHSFEHVPFPREEMMTIYRKLSPAGRCLIRIPTPSSDAWDIYGTDWVQLDAPRHLTLISRSGMTMLAEKCGFCVRGVIDDSSGWSLMASELYRRGIPLERQHRESHFSGDQIAEYERRASSANDAHRGDQAAFILVKS